jgi:hypothetical protein
MECSPREPLIKKGQEPFRYGLTKDAVIVLAQLTPDPTQFGRTECATPRQDLAVFQQVCFQEGDAVSRLILTHGSLAV